MRKKSRHLIGLIGNPNTGKSTLFNTLTGARQHVGNWPGKTVEKKEGEFFYDNVLFKLVDLPGAYSLSAYTEEEHIASDFIHEEEPEIIIQIIDAQNLERNLYVTLQLIEMKAPLLLAINMTGLSKKNGIGLDTEKLSTLLNVPVVEIDARKKKGSEELLKALPDLSKRRRASRVKLSYGTEVNDELEKIRRYIESHDSEIKKPERDGLALKLLEEDKRVEQILVHKPYYLEIKALVEKSTTHLKHICGKEVHSILATIRYGFIRGLVRESMKKDKNRKKESKSDKIDRLLVNKYLGVPIFLIISWLMFQAAFVLSEPPMGWAESLFGFLSKQATYYLELWNIPHWVISLITDGVIGGVGGVLVFVPIIGILFFIMVLLEDSGYMARVAYVMDKFMHRIGLHGKAFIPLILGFGCNVPAIMATRTLESKKDRLLTIMINPFMSCGARLPVYVLFTSAFFSAYQGWVIFSLYFLGIIIAIVMGFIFKLFFIKQLSSPFVIELPPYRWPTMFGAVMHAWEKVWIFIKKAGTIILALSVIIWSLASFPTGVEYGSQESYAGRAGQTISPLFEPLGFGNWQASVALIFGFVAKEVVVSTFGTLYGVEDVESESGVRTLNDALQNDFTPLSAYSFMVFVLLYVPCMATLAVVKRETNSWKWPLVMIVYMTATAWMLAFIVYQGGTLLGYS